MARFVQLFSISFILERKWNMLRTPITQYFHISATSQVCKYYFGRVHFGFKMFLSSSLEPWKIKSGIHGFQNPLPVEPVLSWTFLFDPKILIYFMHVQLPPTTTERFGLYAERNKFGLVDKIKSFKKSPHIGVKRSVSGYYHFKVS